MTIVLGKPVGSVSAEMMEALERAFPTPLINDPSVLKEPHELLWAAAQHSVVVWIKQRIEVRGTAPPNVR